MKLNIEEAAKKIIALFQTAQAEPEAEAPTKTEAEVSEPVAIAAEEVKEISEEGGGNHGQPKEEAPDFAAQLEAAKADFASQISELKASFAKELKAAVEASEVKTKDALSQTFSLMQQVASEPSAEPAQAPKNTFQLHQKANASEKIKEAITQILTKK